VKYLINIVWRHQLLLLEEELKMKLKISWLALMHVFGERGPRSAKNEQRKKAEFFNDFSVRFPHTHFSKWEIQ
jgi:hypothetical protein